MNASPASRGTSSLSVPYSLPSTPIFPPLGETTSPAEAAISEEEAENQTKPSEDLEETEALVEENASRFPARTHLQQNVQQQAKQNGRVQEKVSKTKAKGRSVDTSSQRRAPTLRFGSVGMPSSLLRPLDQEEERKALQLEQQFRKERMATLRRQNELRRRRHAEKQQQLRVAAAQERAAALEHRHQKLQAARVLMERGLAAAATSAPADPSVAVDHAGAVASTATAAPGPSSAPFAPDNASISVAPASPTICCHPAETSPSGAAPNGFQNSPTALSSWATSDRLPVCQVASSQASCPAENGKTVEQHTTHQRCAPRHRRRSSVETVADSRGGGASASHLTTYIPPNAVTGNIFLGAAGAGYRCFPDVSTIAKCFVARAAIGCKEAVSAAGNSRAGGAGGYHCQATQEILSLWPDEHRTLLNATVNSRERVVMLQNNNVDSLVLAASISSQQATEHTSFIPYSPAAPECEKTLVGSSVSVRRVSRDCGGLPSGPAFATRRSLPVPRLVNNTQKIYQPSAGLIDAATPGQAHYDAEQFLRPRATARQTPGKQQRQQHQKQGHYHQSEDGRLPPHGHRKTVQQQGQQLSDPHQLQRYTVGALQETPPPPQGQSHQQNHPKGGPTGRLVQKNDIDNGGLRVLVKHAGRAIPFSRDPQRHSWNLQDNRSRTVLEQGSVHAAAQAEAPDQQQQESGEENVHRTVPRDCRPCGSSDSNNTGSVKCNLGELHPLGFHELPHQLPQQQRHEEQQRQMEHHETRVQQQQQGPVGRTSTAARNKSYAGQFASASRAKAEVAQQRRWKHCREGKKGASNKLQGPPFATLFEGAPVSAAPQAKDAAGVFSCTPPATSPTGNFLTPTVLPPALTAPIPDGAQTGTGPKSSPGVPSAGSFTSAACSVVTATEVPHAGALKGQTHSEKSQQNVAPCTFTGAAASHVHPSSRTLENLQYKQRLQQQQQQHYGQHVNQQNLHTLQNQHQKQEQNPQHSFTGVQVVNRKLKALIEQQLKHASPYASDMTTDGDQVSCLSVNGNIVTYNAEGIRSSWEPRFPLSEGTTVEALGAAAVAQADGEAGLFDSTVAVQQNTLLEQAGDSQGKTVYLQSLPVTDASTWQHLQHQHKQYIRKHEPEHQVVFGTKEHVQDQACRPQCQQQQCKSIQESSECVEAGSCRSHRTCGGGSSPEHSDTTKDSEQLKTTEDCSSCGDVYKQVMDAVCELPEAEDGRALRMDEKGPSMQWGRRKVTSVVKKQDAHRQSASESDGGVHQGEPSETESPVRQVHKRVSSALPAEEKDSSLKHAEQDTCIVQPLHKYPTRQQGARNGKQRKEEEENTAAYRSPHKDFRPKIIRVRARADSDVMPAQIEQKETASAGSSHSESRRPICTKDPHLPQLHSMMCDLLAGPATSSGAEEHSEKGEETEVEEGGEGEDVNWENSRPAGKIRNVAQELESSMVTQEGSSVVEEGNTEGGCSKRCCSTSLVPASTCLSCSASCTLPPWVNTSNACASADCALPTEHSTASRGPLSRSSASSGVPRSTRPALGCGNKRQADDAAAAAHGLSSARRTSRNMVLVRAAGDPISGRKSCEVCSRGSSSNCCAVCDSATVECTRQLHCSSEVCRGQQQQRHRDTASSSSVYVLQEKHRADLSPASLRGPHQQHLDSTSRKHTPPHRLRLDACTETHEINDLQHSCTHSASRSSRCFCCVESPSQERQQQQQEFVECRAAAEREGVQGKRCIDSCVKTTNVRRASVTVNVRSTTRSCENSRRNPVACNNNGRNCNSKDCSNRSPDYSTGLLSDKSRNSSGDNSSSKSSRCGVERTQSYNQGTLTPMCVRRENIPSPTAKREKNCWCACSLPHMPATPRSCSRRGRSQSSTSISRIKPEVTCAVHSISNSECCWHSPEASRSISSSSTCCGSSGDSLDSSTLCCVLSRRSSSKLPACAPPAQNSRTLRSLSTRSSTKGAPKRCGIKDLKLQALTNAERKVEERLLLLDVNQKTLDEQHERRRYLQQQQLQQQQLLLLEQQEHLQQQQQLLTLAQYRNLPLEDEFNPCTFLVGKKESAVSVSTPRGAPNGHPPLQSDSSRASGQRLAATSSWVHSAEEQGESHCDVYCSANKMGRVPCTLQPSVHRMPVRLNGVVPSLFPPPAGFTASPSNPFMISLLTGPTARSQPATGSLRNRSLAPAASMTLTAVPQACLSSRAEDEQKLRSTTRRHSQPLPPRGSAKTAVAFPPLRKRLGDAAASTATAGVTGDAVAAGPGEPSDTICISKTPPASVTKSLQLARRAVAADALPPLRARTSSRTRRQQPLALLPRVT